ncbi:hypothetical protein L249_7069, partial [Ophiocordyceps polyrhachis-furcata BCC 54312]
MAPSAAPPDRAPGDTVGVPIGSLIRKFQGRMGYYRHDGRDLPSCYYHPYNPEIYRIGRIEGSATPCDQVETVLGRRTRCPCYRTTLGTTSQSEAFVPPLDLYLSYCSARTFQLLEANSIAAGIRAAYARGRGRVPSSRTLLPPPPAAATPSSTNTLSSSTTTSSLCLLAGTFITSLSLSLLRSRGADPIRSAPSPPSIFSGVRAASGIYTIGAPLTL